MNRIRLLGRLAVAALLAAALIWALLNQDRFELSVLEATLREFGGWTPAAFVAVFSLATVAFLPGSLFGLAGGALFGPLWGMLWNLMGATLGAVMAFLLARYVSGEWIARKASGRFKQIMDGAEAEGWRFVALTRLVPIIPFNMLNYVLGLTRISLSHYALATFICMAPGAAAYAWLGHAGRQAVEGNAEALRYGVLGLGLLAIVMFLPRLVRRVKDKAEAWISVRDLNHRLASGANATIIDVREPEEFVGPLGHIPGALNIPMSQLPLRLKEVTAAHYAPIVIVCRTDKRSAKAAAALRSTGGTDILVLRGGMEQWSRETAPSRVLDVPFRSLPS